MIKTQKEWWEDFFPVFRPIFNTLSPKATAKEVKYIIKKLDLRAGRKFLDCPCGIGRISIPLARKGIRVTAVDITRSYLDEIMKKASELRLQIDLVHSDMRRINFHSEFYAAANIGTSLGYFEKESDDILALKKLFRALKPGGKAMLNITNRDWIITNFTPTDWQLVGKGKVLQSRKFDFRTSVNRSIWHFIEADKEKVLNVNLRMYSYHELINMMHSVGFIDLTGYGSTRDEPITQNCRMMYIIGSKPKVR